jgi:hypothetical protein
MGSRRSSSLPPAAAAAGIDASSGSIGRSVRNVAPPTGGPNAPDRSSDRSRARPAHFPLPGGAGDLIPTRGSARSTRSVPGGSAGRKLGLGSRAEGSKGTGDSRRRDGSGDRWHPGSPASAGPPASRRKARC